MQAKRASGTSARRVQWSDSTQAIDSMNLIDRTTLRVLFTTLSAAALLGFIWLARKPILAFLFAMLFAYLLEPAVRLLQRRLRVGRGVAIALTYLLIGVAMLTAGAAAGPRVAEEGRHLYETAPQLYDKVASGSIAQQLGRARGWSEPTQVQLQQFIVAHRDEVLNAIRAQSSRATEIAGNALWLLLIPILSVFFLREKSQLAQRIEEFPDDPASRQLLAEVMSDLDEMLSHFVRSQLYLAAISGVVYITTLSLMRVPYALLLGTLGGLLEFIPFVGPLVAGTLILAISFAMNYNHLLMILLFLLLWRGVQDYVVSPRLMGGGVELHPLAAVFGVLAGGQIAGVAGIYFAVPVMAAARILWINWRRYHLRLQVTPNAEIASGLPR
jgi:predicted PurR-regulated permease PerM